MSGHRVWSCFASQRDPEPFRQAMSLRSRGYTTKKLIGWLFFGREGRMYKREDIIIVPIQTFPLSILAFSPLPPRHQVTSRDNHWWSQSLAYVVKDGVWYTFRGENFYYRNVGANASPPSNKKCLSSEGVIQLPSSPPFFGVYVSRRKMLENQSSHFLKYAYLVFSQPPACLHQAM